MGSNKKGVILFIVLAVVLIVVMLSGVILSIISSQSRLTHHQVSRIKAYYAGKGIMNYALEMLRNDTWVLPTAGNVKNACHGTCIDGGLKTYDIVDPADNTTKDIPYRIQVKIYPSDSANPGSTAKLEIKTEYTYTP